MSLQERIEADYKRAFKGNDRAIVSALRMLKSSLKNQEIEIGRELTDAEVQDAIAREVKHRRDALDQYQRAGRPELAAHEQDDITAYLPYLPEQLTEAQLLAIVDETLAGIGSVDPQQIGKVIGAVMAKVKGRADGSVVQALVRKRLGG